MRERGGGGARGELSKKTFFPLCAENTARVGHRPPRLSLKPAQGITDWAGQKRVMLTGLMFGALPSESNRLTRPSVPALIRELKSVVLCRV